MRSAVAFLVLSAAAIVAAWAWLGTAVPMPPSPYAAGETLPCISYAPFRGSQNPWMPESVTAAQIDEDLGRLKAVTSCVRTYSIDHGLALIPELAQRHGMTVMLGLWLSSRPDLSREQIEGAVALALRFPDVIRAIVVGNEVLLRGEMSAGQLSSVIREVKGRVGAIPVTYADVWEFWLRNRDLANQVDFITVHILPYWEDFPIPVSNAAAHLDAIRKQVGEAFPGRDILIGETGWPSAGRMREGARPSPADQARFLHEVLTLAKRQNYRINVIEAFDQPWKRQLEGTVGGHWGLFDDANRAAKFQWGEAVSNHPFWRWQAGGGIVLACVIFAAAFAAIRKTATNPTPSVWAGVGAIAAISGTMAGWAAVNVPLESLFVGGWIRSLAWAGLAILCPIVGAAALVSGRPAAGFAEIIARRWRSDPLAFAFGAVFLLVAVLAMHAALGLVFDPRYRDFPFAALTAALAPFVAVRLLVPGGKGVRPAAETAAAGMLGLCTLYILFNESFANWQSVWFCAGLAVLTACLLRVRAARG